MSNQLDLTFSLSILVRHPKSVDTPLVYGFVAWDKWGDDDAEGGTLCEYDRWDTHWRSRSDESDKVYKTKNIYR